LDFATTSAVATQKVANFELKVGFEPTICGWLDRGSRDSQNKSGKTSRIPYFSNRPFPLKPKLSGGPDCKQQKWIIFGGYAAATEKISQQQKTDKE
jgi:hypothetical protein